MPVSDTESSTYSPGSHRRASLRLALSMSDVARADSDRAAVGHGVARVHDEVHQHLFDLARIGFHRREFRLGRENIFDVFADEPGKHLAEVGDDGVQIEHARLQDLHAAEGEQLPRHGDGFAAAF